MLFNVENFYCLSMLCTHSAITTVTNIRTPETSWKVYSALMSEFEYEFRLFSFVLLVILYSPPPHIPEPGTYFSCRSLGKSGKVGETQGNTRKVRVTLRKFRETLGSLRKLKSSRNLGEIWVNLGNLGSARRNSKTPHPNLRLNASINGL